MDVAYSELLKAKERLHWDTMAPRQKERIDLFQGSLTYKDKRLQNFDVATIIEVIEHLDIDRLESLQRVVFEFAQPKMVIVTTPNREYNQIYDKMNPDQLRHHDHRFEWTTDEFNDWSTQLATKYNYQVEFAGIGNYQETIGTPTQMAIFKKGKGQYFDYRSVQVGKG